MSKNVMGMIFLGALMVSMTGAADEGNSVRMSKAGALFVRDNSFPALGEAYRDPRGLIWGDKIIIHNYMKGDLGSGTYGRVGDSYVLDKKHAENDCASIGARLPTNEEFQQLENDLGGGLTAYDPVTKRPLVDPQHPQYNLTVLPNTDTGGAYVSATEYKEQSLGYAIKEHTLRWHPHVYVWMPMYKNSIRVLPDDLLVVRCVREASK